jgi:phosphopantetheinyl transferase (holo-ACP synthase)
MFLRVEPLFSDGLMELKDSSLDILRELLQCPDLRIYRKPEWGSQNLNYRALIKADLSDLFNDPLLHTSISHCRDLGIVVSSARPVGVDVEVHSRVSEPLIARISSQEESQGALRPASLWCAKEACFKALRPFAQPAVVSEISLGGWTKITSQFETFQLLNPQDFKAPQKCYGVTLHEGAHTFGFFVIHT